VEKFDTGIRRGALSKPIEVRRRMIEMAFIRSRPNSKLTVVYLIAEIHSHQITGLQLQAESKAVRNSTLSMGQVVSASVQNRYTHEDYDQRMQ
jgi:hypothetical protein